MPVLKFTAEDGKVRAVLSDQAKGMERVASASRAAARAERERAAATHAASRAGHTPSASRQTAMIGRLMGGEGGTLLRHGAHFSHLTGGFMAAGVAAVALAASFRALFAASEHAVENAREEAKIRGELNHAIRQATKSADSAGMSAYKTDKDAIDTLVASGGDEAVNHAKRLLSHGPDALKASAALASRGKFNYGNIDLAVSASQTGLMSMSQAADDIAAGNVPGQGSDDEKIAVMLSNRLNRPISSADVRRFTANRRSSVYGTRGDRVGAQEGETIDASLNRFATSDTVFDDGNRKIAGIRDPAAEGRREVTDKLQEQIDIQREAAKAQWKIVEFFETFLGAMGGSGSEVQKTNNLTLIRDSAVN